MEKLNVGIIGFGRIGKEHSGWINSTSTARVASVFDPTPARQEMARGLGFEISPTIESLLGNKSIDIVLVSTPTSMHHEHAMAAIGAQKHVMIEKPIALNLLQAKQIAEAAEKQGVKICVFQNRRWDPDFLAVKQLIESGVLGRVFNIESRLGQWASCVGPAAREYRPNWRNEKSFGGGGLFDWGSHFVDQIWQLVPSAKPVQLFAQLRGNVWTNDCDDFARICINFDNGATGLVEINTTTMHPLPRWQIDGTLGSAQSPASLQFDTRVWANLDVKLAEAKAYSLHSVSSFDAPEKEIWRQFCDAITSNFPLPVWVDSVLKSMQLLDAARESSASGRVTQIVDWK